MGLKRWFGEALKKMKKEGKMDGGLKKKKEAAVTAPS